MKNNKIHINESISDGGGRGSYIAPMQPGIRIFKKSDMQPFNIPVSKYDNAMLEYDSYDGSMDEPKKQIKKIESKAKKISKYMEKHPNLTAGDEDGNNINQNPGKKLKIVPIVTEWIEITQDTISEDLTSNDTSDCFNKIVSGKPLNINQNKKSQNESLRDLIKKVLSENTTTI